MRNLLSVLLMVVAGVFFHPTESLLAEGLTAFSDQDRLAIDRQVLNLPELRIEKPSAVFYGNLAGWGIGRTPLKVEEEQELAKAEHEKVLNTHRTTPAPAEALRVLKKLTTQLPAVSPKQFEYTLTIVDMPEFRSWTPGGGVLYLSRPFYQALAVGAQGGEDRLAFVLAHEMGHIVRRHCRVGYQLLKLQALARRENFDQAQQTELRKQTDMAVDTTGNMLRFFYEPEQEYNADLFAIHLCGNAGFDREAARDVLRHAMVIENQIQNQNLATSPAFAMLSNKNTAEKKNRPSAKQRLQELCFERDGVVHGKEFGVFEFDRQNQQWIKPQTLKVSKQDRVLVLVHGMASSLSNCYQNLAETLSNHRDFQNHRILGFQYPSDGSLTRMGRFMNRELSQVIPANVKPDFICHSAGGLVTRFYVEVEGGAFGRLIMQGTPNQGSDLAALEPMIELKQFVSDLKNGYPKAIEKAILNGQGQIAFDLEPGSLFLTFLNNRQVDRSRYAILRGEKFSGFRVFLLNQAVDLGRSYLTQKVESAKMPTIVKERALQSLEKMKLPEEVRHGDLIVSTKSAELSGVTEIQTFEMHHGELCREPQAINATLQLLK